MKKEDFIEKTLSGLDNTERAKPSRDAFHAVMHRLKGTAQTVAVIPASKVALAAAALSGLFLLNIFLLKNKPADKPNEAESLIQQYGLTDDDNFLIQ